MSKKGIEPNAVKCNKCGDTIQSKYQHNLVACSCKSVMVDGGSEYLRILGDPKNYTEVYVKR